MSAVLRPPARHRCRPPGVRTPYSRLRPPYPRGSVWQCDDCETWYTFFDGWATIAPWERRARRLAGISHPLSRRWARFCARNPRQVYPMVGGISCALTLILLIALWVTGQ